MFRLLEKAFVKLSPLGMIWSLVPYVEQPPKKNFPKKVCLPMKNFKKKKNPSHSLGGRGRHHVP